MSGKGQKFLLIVKISSHMTAVFSRQIIPNMYASNWNRKMHKQFVKTSVSGFQKSRFLCTAGTWLCKEVVSLGMNFHFVLKCPDAPVMKVHRHQDYSSGTLFLSKRSNIKVGWQKTQLVTLPLPTGFFFSSGTAKLI